MSQPTLYLMFGYPGAGKTTAAEVISDLTGAVKFSSDHIRLSMFPKPQFTQAEHDAVYRTIDYLTELLLNKGVSVIYDANLNRYTHRKEKYDICERTGAKPILFWLQVPQELGRNRATLRGHHHLVPADETFETMFDRVAQTIEPPRNNEPFTVINGSHVDKSIVSKILLATNI